MTDAGAEDKLFAYLFSLRGEPGKGIKITRRKDMKTLAKKLMALVLCLAMALGLLGVTSAGAVQSAPKAEESASKVILYRKFLDF